MPRNKDIQSVLIIGAGPIVIGQACEFDYSGAQACKALREEGLRVILVNSNPATIMTDPEIADATYIEPITAAYVEQIIAVERPDALLPTMGGQTALNLALELDELGVLERYQVQLIGAKRAAIEKAEKRELFNQCMAEIGLEVARSGIVHNLEEAEQVLERVGLPCIIRPSLTLGGSGGGIATNMDEFRAICAQGLQLSPVSSVLIDESLIGWKEYELEVIRDKNDNCIIVCGIENVDPMGVHTGDSITVAPIQTLTDKEYQVMRNSALAILRAIGVETGGSNVQFAVDPKSGRQIVIEMNPRVSRSSALASKATGFPIARVAAKLAIGYSLDELANEITGGLIPASFEPTLDYVVTKIPKFTFEKFAHSEDKLNTQMRSVGEVMAIGRNFAESLNKALRSLEAEHNSLRSASARNLDNDQLQDAIAVPSSHRLYQVAEALRRGWGIDQVYKLSFIDPWFLAQMLEIIKIEIEIKTWPGISNIFIDERDIEAWVASCKGALTESEARSYAPLLDLDAEQLRYWKRMGFSDADIAELCGQPEVVIRELRWHHKIHPVFKNVDSCAGEFAASSAYMYSSYDKECELQIDEPKRSVIVLGSGPNRIGQGIEFDYCCVHAAMAIREQGYTSIMVNCNPETVSTDFDCSDRLYFEPIRVEEVLEIVRREQPLGLIVQFGGQTPLSIARALEEEGVPILGTSAAAIERSEDREQFQQLVQELQLKQPRNAIARSQAEAVAAAETIGYPLVVRPSFVLGGRAMEIVRDSEQLESFIKAAVRLRPGAPILLDQYLDHAVEIDVDALADGEQCLIGGILEHIEPAGVHSGDSSCVLPAQHLSAAMLELIATQTRTLARALGACGLLNVQYAVYQDELYLIEVNPRAARTAPFTAKAVGVSLPRLATRAMLGVSLAQQGHSADLVSSQVCVKEAVLPFNKFPSDDPLLGPEMKSTGEVMGKADSFAEAYLKAQIAAFNPPPKQIQGVFLALSSLTAELQAGLDLAERISKLGHQLIVSDQYQEAQWAQQLGAQFMDLGKVQASIASGAINLLLFASTDRNQGSEPYRKLRQQAIYSNVCYTTNIAASAALIQSLATNHPITIKALQATS